MLRNRGKGAGSPDNHAVWRAPFIDRVEVDSIAWAVGPIVRMYIEVTLMHEFDWVGPHNSHYQTSSSVGGSLARAGFTNALFIRLIGITVYNSFIIIPDTLKLCLLCTLCVSLYVYVFCGQNINQEVQFSNIHLDVYEYVI